MNDIRQPSVIEEKVKKGLKLYVCSESMLEEEIIEALVEKFLRNKISVALGTSKHAKTFLKKIALKVVEKELKVKIIPTSLELATLCTSLKLPIASINDREIDLAIEFADMIDTQFNFIKHTTTSLIRDKMIAQSASEMIVVGEEQNYVKRLHGIIPFEVDSFGAERTLLQLDEFGDAEFRLKKNGEHFVTESGNYIINVRFDQIYSLDDLEYDTKKIPGVIETGLFLGFADRILLHNKRIKVISRIIRLEEEIA